MTFTHPLSSAAEYPSAVFIFVRFPARAGLTGAGTGELYFLLTQGFFRVMMREYSKILISICFLVILFYLTAYPNFYWVQIMI